ncbi:MAG TPA: sulfotransferase [Caldilineaceae bacterium]|nr:sulfotransferase [Caldilineaceae bacterium]
MKQLLNRLFGGRDAKPDAPPNAAPVAPRPVIIVSGLPRSGTSMMMKVLEAGGLPVVSDGLRTADTDNPEGYYEFERVKALDKGDTEWVADARGKVVKVISALLEYLPAGHQYRVIFMHRQIEEVLRSQRKMLERRGENPDSVNDAEMAALFAKHLDKVQSWLRSQPNFVVLDVDYNQMLADPLPHIQAINRFLGGTLDEARMASVVNPDLYRNRAAQS